MIVNGGSRVVRMTLQVVASPTIIILTTLEVLLENIYTTGVTHDNLCDDCHDNIVQATVQTFWIKSKSAEANGREPKSFLGPSFQL
jgi:hypothetical protein